MEFQKYNVEVKKKEKKERKQTNKQKPTKSQKFKEDIGTKLIANTRKHKLKI